MSAGVSMMSVMMRCWIRGIRGLDFILVRRLSLGYKETATTFGVY